MIYPKFPSGLLNFNSMERIYQFELTYNDFSNIMWSLRTEISHKKSLLNEYREILTVENKKLLIRSILALDDLKSKLEDQICSQAEDKDFEL